MKIITDIKDIRNLKLRAVFQEEVKRVIDEKLEEGEIILDRSMGEEVIYENTLGEGVWGFQLTKHLVCVDLANKNYILTNGLNKQRSTYRVKQEPGEWEPFYVDFLTVYNDDLFKDKSFIRSTTQIYYTNPNRKPNGFIKRGLDYYVSKDTFSSFKGLL